MKLMEMQRQGYTWKARHIIAVYVYSYGRGRLLKFQGIQIDQKHEKNFETRLLKGGSLQWKELWKQRSLFYFHESPQFSVVFSAQNGLVNLFIYWSIIFLLLSISGKIYSNTLAHKFLVTEEHTLDFPIWCYPHWFQINRSNWMLLRSISQWSKIEK